MDDKKFVNTQHVKHIETLSRAQNSSLLQTGNIEGEGTGSATSDTGSHPVGGVSAPSISSPTEAVSHMSLEQQTKECPLAV